jgi:hypothetical protein
MDDGPAKPVEPPCKELLTGKSPIASANPPPFPPGPPIQTLYDIATDFVEVFPAIEPAEVVGPSIDDWVRYLILSSRETR